MGILELVAKWEKSNLCQMESHARSHRCIQKICNFADRLWPEMPKTISLNHASIKHDGMFVVSKRNLQEYVKTFAPKILRYDSRTESHGYSTLNFGNAKRLGFPRVLVLPHGPIKKYLKNGNVN